MNKTPLWKHPEPLPGEKIHLGHEVACMQFPMFRYGRVVGIERLSNGHSTYYVREFEFEDDQFPTGKIVAKPAYELSSILNPRVFSVDG